MKVLEVVHFFLPKHSAGVEVYADSVARALADRGHEVHLFFSEKILSRPNYSVFTREHRGLPNHVLVNNLLYEGFEETFRNREVESAFGDVLDRLRPDVVHVEHLMLLSMRLPEIAAARGIPTVMSLHDFWLACARFGQLLEHGESICDGPEPARCASCITDFKYSQSALEKKMISAIRWTKETAGFDLAPVVDAWRNSRLAGAGRLLKRKSESGVHLKPAPPPTLEDGFRARRDELLRLGRNVARFLPPSRTVRDRMIRYGLPEDRVTLLPVGIEPLSSAPRPPLDGRDPVFGFVGTIAPHKGVHVLIEAMKHLKGRGELLVYGRSDYYPRYAASLRAQAKGLPVRFMGSVGHDALSSAFERFDVLVMPSVWFENFPMVIQEARSARRPVVVSDLGGMAELVDDGVDGLVFAPGDDADLARKLASLIHEPSLVPAMAERAENPITFREHVDRLEEELTRAAAEAPR
ncbi:MAG: glycosyltransferase family 4 protein [Planctomycetota bacterium JB042]